MKNRFVSIIASVFLAAVFAAGVAFIPSANLRADEVITGTVDTTTPVTSAETDVAAEATSAVDKAAQQMRKHIKNFDKSFTITFSKAYYGDAYALLDKLKDKTFAHTGKPDEGDYLLWSIARMSYRAQLSNGGVKYISYEVQYNMTRSQSKEAAAKADSILKSLKLSGKSDYDKIYAIYHYITSHVTYDFSGVSVGDHIAHSSYAALCKNHAVCQGIALSIYHMMLKSGIDCRLVSGYLTGGAHGWNLVKLGGKYYYVDATNDLGSTNYTYFLKCGASMPTHTPDPAFQTAEFKKKYPLATKDYSAPKPTSKPTPTVIPLPTPKTAYYVMNEGSGKITVTSGDRIIMSIHGSNNYQTWTSSDTKVFDPQDGYARMAGKATVTVTYTDMSNPEPGVEFPVVTKTCEVTVLYKDVTSKKDFWYTPTNYLTAQNVVKGYQDQTLFKPANDCTRAQMLTFMWRLAGSPATKKNTCKFKDVKSSDYYFKPVIWAVEKGITTGYDDGTFKPKNVCTRAQTVTFLWRMAGKPSPSSTKNPFKDVKNTDYFYKATLWASENGILAGYDDGTFRPNGDCLRRQMVTFLYKYDKKVSKKN